MKQQENNLIQTKYSTKMSIRLHVGVCVKVIELLLPCIGFYMLKFVSVPGD